MNKLESMHKRLEHMDKKSWLFKTYNDMKEIRELREEIKKEEKFAKEQQGEEHGN